MIPITPNTRISELVKANRESITAIASLAKPFERLKNPLLRKLLASRVNIAQAAKMGGCTVLDFKQVLEPLGFSLIIDQYQDEGQRDSAVLPTWCSDSNKVQLDVRQTIANGRDPLQEIIESYRQLQENQVLCVINTFIPFPLITLLEKKGAKTFVNTISEQEYHSYFLKAGSSKTVKKAAGISTMDWADFQILLHKHPASSIQELDVRELPMPQPMESILEALTSLAQNEVLYVRHKRVPLHLLEELESGNFTITLCQISEQDVRLLIQHT